jgi:predicted nucleotidyltransferase
MSRIARIPSGEAMLAARAAARQLAADERVQLVYWFGSSVDPQRDWVGDVDLAVWTDPVLSFDELLRIRADLVLSAGVVIDLISLNTAPVVLAREIADTGRCLFARNPEIEVYFVSRARTRYWDFKPYLDEQWRLTAARLEERRRGPAA